MCRVFNISDLRGFVNLFYRMDVLCCFAARCCFCLLSVNSRKLLLSFCKTGVVVY